MFTRYSWVLNVLLLTADDFALKSCLPWDYIKLILLYARHSRQVDRERATNYKYADTLQPLLKGILFIKFAYL